MKLFQTSSSVESQHEDCSMSRPVDMFKKLNLSNSTQHVVVLWPIHGLKTQVELRENSRGHMNKSKQLLLCPSSTTLFKEVFSCLDLCSSFCIFAFHPFPFAWQCCHGCLLLTKHPNQKLLARLQGRPRTSVFNSAKKGAPRTGPWRTWNASTGHLRRTKVQRTFKSE
jgi:hypothetical protein